MQDLEQRGQKTKGFFERAADAVGKIMYGDKVWEERKAVLEEAGKVNPTGRNEALLNGGISYKYLEKSFENPKNKKNIPDEIKKELSKDNFVPPELKGTDGKEQTGNALANLRAEREKLSSTKDKVTEKFRKFELGVKEKALEPLKESGHFVGGDVAEKLPSSTEIVGLYVHKAAHEIGKHIPASVKDAVHSISENFKEAGMALGGNNGGAKGAPFSPQKLEQLKLQQTQKA